MSKTFTISYYLSLDTIKSNKDILLTGKRKVNSLNFQDTSSGSVKLTVPKTTPLKSFYLLACSDDKRKIKESNEKNNCIASQTMIKVRNVSPNYSLSYLETDPSPSYLTLKNNNMFWSDASETPIKKIAENANVTSLARKIGVTVNEQYMFWIDDNRGWGSGCSNGLRILYKTSLDGTSTTELMRGSNCRGSTSDIVIDGDYVYWVNSSLNASPYAIIKTPIAGGDSIVLTETSEPIAAIAGDAENVYWEELRFQNPVDSRNAILKLPKIGGTPTVVVEGFTYLQGNLVVANDEIIFADDYSASTVSYKYRIMKVSVSGGNVTTLADINSFPIEDYIRKIATDGIDIYWADKLSVNKVPVNGGTTAKLADADAETFAIIDLAVNNDTVFWTELPVLTSQGGPLKYVSKVGGTVKTLFQDKVTPFMLGINSAFIIWIEGFGGALDLVSPWGLERITKMSLSGGSPTTIVSGVSIDTPPIAADDNYVYIGDRLAVKKVSILGGQVEILAKSGDIVENIATDGFNIYWIDRLAIVSKVSVNGGDSTKLANMVDSPVGPSRIFVINGYVYWMVHYDTILKVPSSGGAVTTIASGLPFVSDFVVDGTNIYFAEQDTGQIKKISVNGGSPTYLASIRRGSKTILAVNEQTLYWIDQINVGAVSIYGGTQKIICSSSGDPSSLTINGTDIYWTDTKGYIFVAISD
jgi:hypothetical protein